jgi:hypothetical protein
MSKVFSIFIITAVLVSFVFIGSPVFADSSAGPGSTSRQTIVRPQLADPADSGQDTYGLTPSFTTFYLPAAAFTPRKSTTTYDCDASTGYINRTAGTDNMVWAPLLLPPGALLHGIRAFYYDNSAQAIDVYVTKYLGESAATIDFEDIGSFHSTGTPGYTSNYISVGETIRYLDPTTGEQGYVVNVRLNDASANMRFRGVRVLYYLQLSPAPATASFSDVPTTHPFFQYIEALYSSRITTGYAGTTNFGPDDYVTRGQMAAFLGRALGLHWQN